jgi:uncharacterized membrane protein YhaH (DUF805 family)
MLGAIKYNLTHLLDFSGRDARQTFWYYVAFLVVLNVVIGVVVYIPAMVSSIGTAMEAAQAGAGEQEVQARMMAQMQDTLGTTMWISIGISAAMPLLLIAAFVRRLHDADKPGWWALLPLAMQAASIAVSIRISGEMQAMMREALAVGNDPAKLQSVMAHQSEYAAYGLIGWIGILIVVGFGVLRSTDGPNRYGAEPVRF